MPLPLSLSLQLESKYLYSADAKMAELQQLSSGVGGAEVQFVKDAVRQLVEARHTLIASYGYGYFIMVRRVKEQFERLQVTTATITMVTVTMVLFLG